MSGSNSAAVRAAAFTLIEVMLAVVLLALLTTAAALSFAEPLRRARARDAVEAVRAFDAGSRQHARRFGAATETVFDVPDGTLWRRDAGRGTQIGSRATLPAGCRVAAVRFADRRNSGTTGGRVVVRSSAAGAGRSYAVRLVGPGLDAWLVVAGLTGELTQVRDETEVEQIFAAVRGLGNRATATATATAAAAGDDVD